MDERDRVPCPDCGELIVRGAKVCRFCGLGRAPVSVPSRLGGDITNPRHCLGLLLILAIGIGGFVAAMLFATR
jgi:hypothetical protein